MMGQTADARGRLGRNGTRPGRVALYLMRPSSSRSGDDTRRRAGETGGCSLPYPVPCCQASAVSLSLSTRKTGQMVKARDDQEQHPDSPVQDLSGVGPARKQKPTILGWSSRNSVTYQTGQPSLLIQ